MGLQHPEAAFQMPDGSVMLNQMTPRFGSAPQSDVNAAMIFTANDFLPFLASYRDSAAPGHFTTPLTSLSLTSICTGIASQAPCNWQRVTSSVTTDLRPHSAGASNQSAARIRALRASAGSDASMERRILPCYPPHKPCARFPVVGGGTGVTSSLWGGSLSRRPQDSQTRHRYRSYRSATARGALGPFRRRPRTFDRWLFFRYRPGQSLRCRSSR